MVCIFTLSCYTCGVVKIKAPLISLGARGLVASISYLTRRTVKIAEKKPEILDVKSPGQLSWRHMYQKAVALWNALSPAEKREWESLARPKHMTGFAWFISQALKPNPGLYLPLQGGTMSGDVDMDKHRLLKLPTPIDDQEPVTKKYFEDNLPVGGYTEGAKVYRQWTFSVPTGTETVIPFDLEYWDTDNIHDNVANNTRLTCKTAGKYIVVVYLTFQPNAAGLRYVAFAVNGVLEHRRAAYAHPTDVTFGGHSNMFDLSINDYVEVSVWQNSGGALSVYSGSGYWGITFMMHRIG